MSEFDFVRKCALDLRTLKKQVRKIALTCGMIRLNRKRFNRGKTDRKDKRGEKPQTTRAGTPHFGQIRTLRD